MCLMISLFCTSRRFPSTSLMIGGVKGGGFVWPVAPPVPLVPPAVPPAPPVVPALPAGGVVEPLALPLAEPAEIAPVVPNGVEAEMAVLAEEFVLPVFALP